ncbi:MAG: ABC transporter ATP-binding protein [Chloroflexi bacterium]|nr:ABC transporter ATP-binding protein [Chloroflexota bacterium]
MIETEGLTKRFGEITAVDGLSLKVAEGEILALLGPNGAGKTTTVRLLSSILRPDAGWAKIAGHDVVEEGQVIRRKVGLLTEFPGLYLRMPALDYLTFFGESYGLAREEVKSRALRLLKDFGMEAESKKPLSTFSKGMRQKVALLRALIHDPPILFLDEPTSAMDPHSAKMVRDTIRELGHDRRTILLCTHNLTEAEYLADRLAIINHGRIVAQGRVGELKGQLLGPPLLELRLARPLDGLLSVVHELVEVESGDATWIRYRTPDPQSTNPILLRRLAQEGAEVVTLSEVSSSLEEVYLRIIGQKR